MRSIGRPRGRKESDAISPVIGVILMVAITVVLAAVLYVMIGPLINPDEEPPEDVLLLDQGPTNGNPVVPDTWDTYFTVMAVRSANKYEDTSLSYVVMTDNATILTDATISFSDANANGYVSEGDSILVHGMTDEYQGANLKVLHKGVMIGQIPISFIAE